MGFAQLWPLLGLFFAIGIAFWQRKRLHTGESDHAYARAGAVAERLGLELVEGDPNTNFVYARALGTKRSGVMPEVRVRLEGAPGGRHTAIHYYDRTDVAHGVLQTTHTTHIDARIVVAVHEAFPAFEVMMKDYGHFAAHVRPQLRANPCPTGDAQLDGLLQVKCADPRVAPVIAEGLRSFLGSQYVHIIGMEGTLTFQCTAVTTSFLGTADQVHLALVEMAESLERVSRGAAA
jgi:hypothetical protein